MTFEALVESPNSHFIFSRILLAWNSKMNKRHMPWKGEKDPYKIWLSEIILQQTRVEQGLKYYEKFIKAFPNVTKLANATDGKVYKNWEGLGYYSRCKNLLATARQITREKNGEFPDCYSQLIKLKGVGPYTAAAIASFAFNQPFAVVDGNVYRVLARIFGIDMPIDSPMSKKYFARLADKLLDKKHPAVYNQAIMDFGATVCKPVPECGQCPFSKNCKAKQGNMVELLPVKSKKITVKRRWFYYIVPEFENKLGVRQRVQNDIWHHLFEFSLIESGKQLVPSAILKEAEKRKLLQKNTYKLVRVSRVYQQRLTHQFIAGNFLRIKLQRLPENANSTQWINATATKKFAFPQFINQYLKDEGILKK